MKYLCSFRSFSAMLILLAAMFVSCEHKELCFHHDHVNYCRLRINADWVDFLPLETPTGMTVSLYPEDGSKPITVLTNNIDYAIVNLPVGLYDLLVFNQSETEFGTMTFCDMDNFLKSGVRGVETPTRWYKSRLPEETVIAQPEWIGTDVQTSLKVTPEMVEITKSNIEHNPTSRVEGDTILTTAYPQNIISTLKVTVHINGIYNLRAARAAITGMADGFMLGRNCPSAEHATQLLEEWNITIDEKDPTKGNITGTITTFGLPDGHSTKDAENELQLSLLLVDNKTIVDCGFLVGNLFEYKDNTQAHVRTALCLNLYLDKTLPDVEPEGGGSGGFDATVDDWGDEENIDIGM